MIFSFGEDALLQLKTQLSQDLAFMYWNVFEFRLDFFEVARANFRVRTLAGDYQGQAGVPAKPDLHGSSYLGLRCAWYAFAHDLITRQAGAGQLAVASLPVELNWIAFPNWPPLKLDSETP